jgi:hypothetical protein
MKFWLVVVEPSQNEAVRAKSWTLKTMLVLRVRPPPVAVMVAV